MDLCQKLRGVSYVNFVLTRVICWVLNRSSWGSSRFANQQGRRVLSVGISLFRQRKKKVKKYPQKACSQAIKQHQGCLLVNGGSPSDSQRLGSCSLKLVGETCEEQARSRSVKLFPQAESLRTKHIDPFLCAEGKVPGSKKAHDGNYCCLLFSSVSAFGKKTPALFLNENGFIPLHKSSQGEGY